MKDRKEKVDLLGKRPFHSILGDDGDAIAIAVELISARQLNETFT